MHTPMAPAPRSNAAVIRELVDSPLAFHGLKPHVSDQLTKLLAGKVVALELLPARIREIAEAIAKGGSAP